MKVSKENLIRLIENIDCDYVTYVNLTLFKESEIEDSNKYFTFTLESY